MARHKLYPESVRPGIPKMPRLPPGWRAVPFGELLSPVCRPAELDDEVIYQLVTAKRSRGGIVPREALTGAEIKTKTQFYVAGGDFLISRRQIIHGACGFVPEALSGAVVSGEYDVLAVGPALLPEYLEAFTHTTYFQQSCFQSSVGVDIEKMVFDLDHWFTYPMPLPPLEEQARIAGALGRIKAALRANERALEQAQRVKKALLSRLLSEGIGHTRFKETEIGRVPEGWGIVAIGEVATVTNGSTPSRGRDDYWDRGTVAWLASGKVNDYRIKEASEFITRPAQLACGLRLHPPGTVVVGLIGQGRTRGMAALLEIAACVNQNMAAVVPTEALSGEFLLQWMTWNYEGIRRDGRGSNQDALTSGLVKAMRIPLPPIDEQRTIGRALVALDTEILGHASALRRMDGILRTVGARLLAVA